tara:strand:- start:9434 stop:10258 length:825 start_codon:yes stop_codon:yes gene_type:complete
VKISSLLASLLLVFPAAAMANTLPVEKIRDLAVQAGFSPKDAGTMAAICKSESGGFAGAHNSKYPDDSYGLCQINMLDEPGYMLGAERREKFGIGSNEALKDPLTNLKAAKQVFDSQGFGAWSDYKNEKYLKHLPAPQMPETEYDATSSNGSSNLDEAKSGSEEQKAREALAEASKILQSAMSGSQAAQAPSPEGETPVDKTPKEEKPVVEQSDKAESDEQNKKDAEILKALFAAQMKQQQAASDAALLQSFMDRTKSAVGNAMSNYQMGRSVL